MAITHKIEQGQTLADAALINFGNLESLADIATTEGGSMTDNMAVGRLIKLPFLSLDAAMSKVVRFFSERVILPPATNLQEDVFAGIEFWGIEYDFIVV